MSSAHNEDKIIIKKEETPPNEPHSYMLYRVQESIKKINKFLHDFKYTLLNDSNVYSTRRALTLST